jgi:DNA-binding response OmpR family regulator
MEPGPHIVVVEDEPTQRHLLVDYLAGQNFRVTGVSGGADLRKLVARDRPALVLLDVGLPGEDGFAIARWLRESSARVGIIMVTAASDTVDRVIGLEIGADDYIAKPFEPRELLAAHDKRSTAECRTAHTHGMPGVGSREASVS